MVHQCNYNALLTCSNFAKLYSFGPQNGLEVLGLHLVVGFE